jgi:hypothetical protein
MIRFANISGPIYLQRVARTINTSLRAGLIAKFVAILLLLIAAPTQLFAAEPSPGEQIYRRQCARCHGANGEGVVKEYGKPLVGDRSVVELTKIIDKTMPEDAPEKCVGEDARVVAQYIYDTFYSPVAQARNQPARIELARLTVRQYRQSVADLIGSFRSPGPRDDRAGLRGEYYKSRQYKDQNRVIDRLDPQVEFDFKESSPEPDKIPTEEFAVRWNGGVFAPETGEYDFILASENGAKLWINDTTRPLIDAGVKSGKGIERRESIRLLGGRFYPLRLEFFKSKQAKEKSAAVTLKWQPPHRVTEVIPTRNLSPNHFSTVCVVGTPFPPDDRSVGYERGTSISKAWDQATTDAAIEVATYVGANLGDISGVKGDFIDKEKRLKEFCYKWAARAFRRPLTDEQKTFYVDLHFENAPDKDTAVKRVVLLTLMSPSFLYNDFPRNDTPADNASGRTTDPYDIASRLSYGLWDSLPDDQLLKAAAAGQLKTRDQVQRQAERMVTDLRTRSKMQEFFHQWLNADRFTDIAKDSKRFPEFDEAIVSDLRTALDLFLDDVIWSEGSDYRQLLLADSLYLNGRLAKFYGAGLQEDAPFQKITLEPTERAGVLTHPYLMAGLAYTTTSSPIHRGVFVARSVLGRSLRPPPEAVAPLAPELHADLTTRQRVALQTKEESCQSCHRMINPLGFAFENFDAVGRFRKKEQGKPIDASGTYQTRTGEAVKFTSVRKLATYLAESDETHEAFVEQLFHYIVKQPIRAFGPTEQSDLEKSFAQHQYNIRRLLVEIVTTSALYDGKPAKSEITSK